MSGKLLFEYVTSITLQTTTLYACSCVEKFRLRGLLQLRLRKAAKRLRKPKSSSPSDFCRIYALVLLLHGTVWHILVNCIKRGTIV